MIYKKTCRECGAAYTATRPNALFCSGKHREQFNKRRRTRGAEMYDLTMIARFGKDGQAKEAVGLIERVIDAYRTADRALRDGRQSWQDWADAVMALPLGYSKEGDKR